MRYDEWLLTNVAENCLDQHLYFMAMKHRFNHVHASTFKLHAIGQTQKTMNFLLCKNFPLQESRRHINNLDITFFFLKWKNV